MFTMPLRKYIWLCIDIEFVSIAVFLLYASAVLRIFSMVGARTAALDVLVHSIGWLGIILVIVNAVTWSILAIRLTTATDKEI